MRRQFGLYLLALAAMGAMSVVGCNGGSPPPPPPPIAVSVSPTNPTVQEGATQAFTATVSNDSANNGVTWSVSCSVSSCGTVSPASSASGATTTYTAPGPPASTLTVTLTATSVADTTKKATATITVPAITVTVAPSSAPVNTGSSAPFTATVTNDSSATPSVTWTVSCSTAPCGSVSPTSSASGASVTYTAPTTAPSSGLAVTLTATSVADTTKTATANITVTVPPITVTVAPPSATVNAGSSAPFTATVTNDPSATPMVNWTVSCSTAPCGSVSPTTTASNVATSYTAPATPPSSNLTVTLTATSVTDATKSASATITVPTISVTISPLTPTVDEGTSQVFTATVNGTSNQTVTWALTQSGAACSPTCGSLSSNTSNPTTYTAPGPPASTLTLTITATAAADSTKSASTTITVPAITVSVSPITATVVVTATPTFTATVSNDPANAGVTWTLTQGTPPAPCSPACGTLTNVTTTSATYNAPATVPTPATVTLTATSVTDKTKTASATITVTTAAALCGSAGTGNNSLLAAGTPHAFLVQGFDPGPVAIAGSFTPDGKGGITAGEADINRTTPGPSTVTFNPTASFYTIGADNRGCLVLTSSAGTSTVFRFALGSISGTPLVAAKGRIIEFDDTNGSGTRGSGIIRKQAPTSFAASLSGTYALTYSGNDPSNFGGRFAEGMAITATAGNFSNGTVDIDDTGVVTFSDGTCPTGCGTYSPAGSLDAFGRGTSLGPAIDAFGFFLDMAFYQVSASEVILISTDAIASGFFEPLVSGEGLLQTVPAGGFSNSSLSGNSVFHQSGSVSSVFGTTGTTNVTIGLATANGSGMLTSVVVDQDNGSTGTGTVSSTTLVNVTYSVAPSGRVMLGALGLGTDSPPVLYLVDKDTAFIVGTDAGTDTGFLEPQVGSSFGNSTLNAAYSFGVVDPSDSAVSMNSGAVTVNGMGSFTGTADSSSTGGLTPGQTISGTYTINSNGTGTITDQNMNPGALIVISSSKFLLIVGETAGKPAPSVTVVEQ